VRAGRMASQAKLKAASIALAMLACSDHLEPTLSRRRRSYRSSETVRAEVVETPIIGWFAVTRTGF